MRNITQQHRYYNPAIAKLRLFLMAGAIVFTYGLHVSLGDLTSAAFSFVFPALYIISGYTVLRESRQFEQRILRTIKRTAICFAILFAVYLGLSLLIEKDATVAAVTTKAFWVDFLLLNQCALPVGFTIWYIQALLYAYILIYLMSKLKLLKYDIYIAAFCLIVAILTGELSSVIGFHFLGHAYIGGNFVTRALPYILIGRILHRNNQRFTRLTVQHYGLMMLAGVFLAVAECVILVVTDQFVYAGHFLGMGLTAVGICFFAFFLVGMGIRSKSLNALSRWELMIPYFVSSPIYCLVNIQFYGSTIGSFAGLITLILSFVLLYVYAFTRSLVRGIPKHKFPNARKR